MELIEYCQDTVTLLALGGQSMSGQQALLPTPGRLVTHLEAGNLTPKDSVDTVVIDEADLVVSFRYGENIRTIFNALPKACQTFCMSATLSPEIEKLKRSVLHNPAVVKLEEGATDGNFSNSIFFRQGFATVCGATTRRCDWQSNLLCKLNRCGHIIEEFNRGIFDYLIATDDSLDHHKARNEDEEDIEEDAMEDEEEEGDAACSDPIDEEELGKIIFINFR
ncbi:hypothetical protein PsorP6_018881 [Peronosclerospora sorghi]|nr:hypothetical protein PsorP6_018881 [Peronosclerospora sorghi]